MESEKPEQPDPQDQKLVKSEGLGQKLRESVKEDLELLKQKASKDNIKVEVENLKDPTRTQIYKSMFRVKHEPTPRSRSLGVLTNVFLHLHPAKINRDAVRLAIRGNGRNHLSLFM